jgi:hypothetical protein
LIKAVKSKAAVNNVISVFGSLVAPPKVLCRFAEGGESRKVLKVYVANKIHTPPPPPPTSHSPPRESVYGKKFCCKKKDSMKGKKEKAEKSYRETVVIQNSK